MFIKGAMWISSDPLVCYRASVEQPLTRILSLDEDNTLKELSPGCNPSVFSGAILLPPTESLWGEIDGDIELFKYYYELSLESASGFIYALIGILHLGGDIIIYSPEEDQTGLSLSNHSLFLVSYLERRYGLHVGTDNDINTFSYNNAYNPQNACGLYNYSIISAYEFLQYYPSTYAMNMELYNKLINDINPYGITLEEKIKELDRFNEISNTGRELHPALISI